MGIRQSVKWEDAFTFPFRIAATTFETAADLGTDIPENTGHIREAEDAIAATRSFSFHSFSFSLYFSLYFFSSSFLYFSFYFPLPITHVCGDNRSAIQAMVT